jgi:hypothetical protein
MLDINFIPNQQDSVKIFYAAGTTAWQTWQKPRGCKFIWMMCIGGGAGGGGGPIGDIGAGAGGSGGVVRALFPANVLPDTLYVQTGLGGGGGAGGDVNTWTSGGSGGKSFISVAPTSAVSTNIVCTSGGATSAASNNDNAGGAGESIATVSQAPILNLGNFLAIAGQAGAPAATSITPLGTTITCGGAGGGYGAFVTPGAGGNISPVNLGISSTPTISGGPATGGVAGESGIANWKPLYFLGGAGGGGGIVSGGKGGNGAYGSGGGGGGGSASVANGGIIGGAGGKGGDGLVIIATF